jgi:hypothetical protein
MSWLAMRQLGIRSPPPFNTLEITATMLQAAPVLGLTRIFIRYKIFREMLRKAF